VLSRLRRIGVLRSPSGLSHPYPAKIPLDKSGLCQRKLGIAFPPSFMFPNVPTCARACSGTTVSQGSGSNPTVNGCLWTLQLAQRKETPRRGWGLGDPGIGSSGSS
jgi:hypothetical protein